jgi:hypothetical protein
LNKQSNTRDRLRRRDEREASRVGAAPRARRDRTAQAAPARKQGFLSSLSTTTMFAIAGVAFIAAILVYAVVQANNVNTSEPSWMKAIMDDSARLPGQYIEPHPGPDGVLNTQDDRQHVAPGVIIPICSEEQLASGNISDPICYNSNPPTSGPHTSTPQGWGNMENPAPKENIVHSMEHGGVYIWYNTNDQAAIDLIHSVVDDNRDRRRFVGSTIYNDMPANTVAITAWTRLDKFSVSELTKERLQEFINEHHKRFNPEGF